MSLTIQQPKEKNIKLRISLLYIDSSHFVNNSLDNLIRKIKRK